MNGASLEGRDGPFNERGFVQGVGMDGDLDIMLVRNREAAVDGRRGGTPILVEFETNRPGLDLIFQTGRQCRVPLASESKVQRKAVHGLEHGLEIERRRRAGGGAGADRGAGATADHGGQSRGNRLVRLLGTDEMDVGVESPRGDDQSLAGDDLGGHANDHPLGDAGHHVGITRLAEASDPAVLDANVRLIDAGVVEDDGISDDAVQSPFRSDARRLTHAFTNHLPAAKFAFITVVGVVALDLEFERGVTKPDSVPGGGAEHVGILRALHLVGHARKGKRIGVVGSSANQVVPNPRLRDRAATERRVADETLPPARLLPPRMTRLPLISTNRTVRVSPGSNRTAVPAGMSSRRPYANARSKRRPGFVSVK